MIPHRNSALRRSMTYISAVPLWSDPSLLSLSQRPRQPDPDSEYLLASRPTNLTSTDNLVLVGLANNGTHNITITFNVDGNGNITSIQGNVTTFKQVKAESNKITVSKEEWEEAQNGIRDSIPPLLAKNSVFLRDYDKSMSAQGKKDLKRSLGTAKKFLATVKKKGDKVKEEAWNKMISYIESISSESTPTVSLENGDTVTQNGKRYTIVDKEILIGEDEVTGEQVTLTTDNLIKEETQCIPVKFKMI